MALSLRKIKDEALELGSRVVDQANPFDNGRTFKQRTPTSTGSVQQQAIRVATQSVPKLSNEVIQRVNPIRQTGSLVGGFTRRIPEISSSSPARFLNNALIRPTKLTGSNLQTISLGDNPYKGSLRQQGGQALQDVVNIGSLVPIGRAASLATQGTASLGRRVAQEAVLNAKIGAGIGGTQGLSTSLKNESNLADTGRNIVTNAAIGGAIGGAVGGALPVAGAAARQLPTVARQTAKTAQRLDERAFTPRLMANDVRTLVDHSNYLSSVPEARGLVGSALSTNIARARDIASRSGIDISQGTRAQQLEAVNRLLDNVSQRNKGVAQGGYVGVKNPAPVQPGQFPTNPPVRSVKMAANGRMGGTSPDQALAEAAQANKQRYAKPSVKMRFMETMNPYNAGAKVDRAYAKSLGIPQRDLPKTQSLEALADQTRNSRQAADVFLRQSKGIAPVVQKYRSPEQIQEFNTYRLFMRDLEQQADGRPALVRDFTPAQQRQFVADYEARNPQARADLKALVKDIEDIQDQAVRAGVVDAREVSAARTKKGGGRYEYYTPAQRAMPEEIERATINANSTGSIANQKILQDLKGSDIPLDPSFDALTDYANIAFRDIARTRLSQVAAQRAQQGLAPGRFIQTAENEAQRKALQARRKAGEVIPKNDYAQFTADPSTGLQVVSGRMNGQTFKYETTPEMARFLQGIGQEQTNTVLKAIGALSQPIRAGLTGVLNPPFAILNASWNAIMAPTLSPQGFRVLGPKAVAEAFRAINMNNDFQKRLYAAGAQRFTGTLQTNARESSAAALAAERGRLAKLKYNASSPKRFWNELDVLSAKLENMQRTGVGKAAYDARIRKGGTPEQAIADAAYAYNNVLPNFGRQSNIIRQGDKLAMYLGASQAGTRSLLTAVKRDPVGVSARLAAIGTVLTGASAAALQNMEAQEFYDDMVASKKEYLLDNNVIIVLPGASKDPKTGEWTGIVKIPLAPELRPVNASVWRSVYNGGNETGVPVGQYAKSLLDFTTGQARTLSNPVVNLAGGLMTGKDPRTGQEVVPAELATEPLKEQTFSSTSELAKKLGPSIGISPLKVDYVLQGLGLPGQVTKGVGSEGGAVGAVKENVANRFTGAKGRSQTGEYFDEMNRIASEITDKRSRSYFQGLHKKSDSESLLNSATKASIYLSRPDVFEAEKRLEEFNRRQGRASNPLFDLAPEQVQKVLTYRSGKAYNSAGQNRDKNGDTAFTALGLDEPWYDQFQQRESDFYSQLATSGEAGDIKTFSGAIKPKPTPDLQAKLDYYYTLGKGTGQRSAFLKANPDVLDYWAQNNNFTNDERIALGFKPIADEDGSSYGSRGRGGGSPSGGSLYRYAVSLNAGGDVANPRISAPKSARLKYTRKVNTKTGKPKVALKKNKV